MKRLIKRYVLKAQVDKENDEVNEGKHLLLRNTFLHSEVNEHGKLGYDCCCKLKATWGYKVSTGSTRTTEQKRCLKKRFLSSKLHKQITTGG